MSDLPADLAELEVRPQEQLLIDALDTFTPGRMLSTSQGVAQLAAAGARRWPGATVYCHYLDLYCAELRGGTSATAWQISPSAVRRTSRPR